MILSLFFVQGANANHLVQSTQIKKINRHLQSTPMRGTGKILYNQGKKHNVNPYFVIAIAHKESSLGHAACSNNSRNVWGLGACGRAWTPPYFNSWTEAINYFVRFLKQRWPYAETPYQYYGYCAGCEHSWATHISYYMREILGVVPKVEFK